MKTPCPFLSDERVLTALLVRSLAVLSLIAGAALVGVSTAAGQSLFADPKARRPGDIVTIVLSEQTTAQRSSSYDANSGASLGMRSEVTSPSLSGRFGADASFDKDAFSSNETAQSDLLQGTMTAKVVDINDAGNLVIEGERRLSVNGVEHILHVTGTARPLDVRYNNTLPSRRIAGAQVEYKRNRLLPDFFRPATYAKVGAVLAIGAAIFFGAQ